MTNDNWLDETELALDAASKALDVLLEIHHTRAIPAMIGALVNWAVHNAAAAQMARSLTSAAQSLPEIDAAYREGENR